MLYMDPLDLFLFLFKCDQDTYCLQITSDLVWHLSNGFLVLVNIEISAVRLYFYE